MREKKSDSTSLTAAKIRKFEILLLSKRNEILGDVLSMEDETLGSQRSGLSNISTQMADAGSDNYEIENMLGLMDSEIKLLRDIDAALGRIENGTYGICEGSGKPIPIVRLKAIPWAKYCVEYASMLEKNLVKKTAQISDREYDFGNDEQDDNSKYIFRRTAI